MALITSTPTTLTVTSLPAWLPVGGAWASVALNKVNSTTVKGDFPPQFPASRDVRQLFSDFTGAVWNPYYGTYGAWLIMGGGHQQYLGNEVYAWEADTRQWKRLSNPTYPGRNSAGSSLASLGDWAAFKEPPFASDLLSTYGELEAGVPASNHSRWHPCIIPPSLGGGPRGSLLIAYLSSIHTSGNGGAHVAHAFDCATGKWSRVGTVSGVSDRGRSWSSCLDTKRGVIYRPGEQVFTRMSLASGEWADSGIRINGTAYSNAPCAYVPTKDVVVLLTATGQIGIVDASLPTTITPASMAGTPPPPQPGQSLGLTWVADLGPSGSICTLDYTTGAVYACGLPADPYKGNWTWSTLVRTSPPALPTYSAYNHFQYAQGLKSFFLANGETDSMWCFRPREIVG